ncbi:profilin, required for normal timing of actin polymerization in response to thermal stress [Friedmanniomyces endolithicus]|uniref:Profilin, required for normal timing of actin polymerization in response to thermal stress n=1 Tax=Friedmanniomyces endolithicus TaxID=329885 RepID=A0AAN6K684_9PEZI|nr:profilin, required for normal timing of actin polymerization in response to thermal stress [Friedmanniomyces endolithicus]KAK0966840.1 profilin, required for normal timing of actin polymerization in response to thermal stress [Friedmanniomyces endolithicus]KAK1002467.1 profilin, required for normal timing of actin polymerization in response to thermal stress [Friedmanniomyces endolithicus]KAK1049270.1 profilin, required for normal timing of actin polymerization in response to thermal stress [
MVETGVVYRDLGHAPPLPNDAAADAANQRNKTEGSPAISDEPTLSHTLAVSGNRGDHAQQSIMADGIKDLGWNQDADEIPAPLVGGLPNEELWILLRRFNKQMYHVKEYPYAVPGNLDLNIADEEEFSPDKLRANLERLYMTVGISMIGCMKHIMRIRSWNEARRTGAFLAAYSVAWLFDLIVPLFIVFLITIIMYPPSRDMLFPPAPIALVSSKTGGLQKPKAGVLGSTDSATGAPENHKGEAVEAEASNLVNSIAQIALASASGKHPQSEPQDGDEGSLSSRVPDPTSMATSASGAGEKDKAKIPMETAVWNKMRPTMHALADVADTWERFGNALGPTPPFPHDAYRLRFVAILVPILAASPFITNYMVVKSMTAGAGIGFFADPLIWRGLDFLNTRFPGWQKMIELRNTIFHNVPTNAQLTITLLRLGEANKTPLPPPPYSHEPPPDKSIDLTDEHLHATGSENALNASPDELKAALEHDPNTKHETTGSDIDASKQQSHGKKGSKLLAMFKSGVKGTIEAGLGADHLKAKVVGSEHAKNRLGVIPDQREDNAGGPVDFKCRYNGKRGHAYLRTSATIPSLAFALGKDTDIKGTEERAEAELHPVWSIAIADLKELKKVGGLGWKAKLVVGWALGRDVADGLEIIDKQGNTWALTAMVMRDELFNRLIAIGGQKWESW